MSNFAAANVKWSTVGAAAAKALAVKNVNKDDLDRLTMKACVKGIKRQSISVRVATLIARTRNRGMVARIVTERLARIASRGNDGIAITA
jgi:hypothetical protein